MLLKQPTRRHRLRHCPIPRAIVPAAAATTLAHEAAPLAIELQALLHADHHLRRRRLRGAFRRAPALQVEATTRAARNGTFSQSSFEAFGRDDN